MAEQLYVATYRCGCLAGAAAHRCDWVEAWERDRRLKVALMPTAEFHARKWTLKSTCPHRKRREQPIPHAVTKQEALEKARKIIGSCSGRHREMEIAASLLEAYAEGRETGMPADVTDDQSRAAAAELRRES